jgi:hypothetical protein
MAGLSYVVALSTKTRPFTGFCVDAPAEPFRGKRLV